MNARNHPLDWGSSEEPDTGFEKVSTEKDEKILFIFKFKKLEKRIEKYYGKGRNLLKQKVGKRKNLKGRKAITKVIENWKCMKFRS